MREGETKDVGGDSRGRRRQIRKLKKENKRRQKRKGETEEEGRDRRGRGRQ
jgi:hypothetical protein